MTASTAAILFGLALVALGIALWLYAAWESRHPEADLLDANDDPYLDLDGWDTEPFYLEPLYERGSRTSQAHQPGRMPWSR